MSKRTTAKRRTNQGDSDVVMPGDKSPRPHPGYMFKLIRIEDGGATDFDFDTAADLVRWLREEGKGHWHEDAKNVALVSWAPGHFLQFGCGWIFCVK